MLRGSLAAPSIRTTIRLGASVGLIAIAVIFALHQDWISLNINSLISVGLAVLVAVSLLLYGVSRWMAERFLIATARTLVAEETGFALIADGVGKLIVASAVAEDVTGDTDNAMMILTHKLKFAAAEPAEMLFRLQAVAHAVGRASEIIYTKNGTSRVSVLELRTDCYLWRLDLPKRAPDELEHRDAIAHLIAGPSGTVTYLNNAAKELFGRRPTTLHSIFEDDLPVSGGIAKLNQARWKDCMVLHRQLRGGRVEVFCFSSDFEAEIAHAPWSEVEELPVPLLKLSAGGDVLAANREARLLLKNDFKSKRRLSDHVEGLGRPVKDWVHELSCRNLGATESEFLRGVGEAEDMFLEVRLVRTGDENNSEVLAVLADRTDFKALEAQFVQSQKMQAVGQLAGGVAHDFNNLLTAISGHCDLLLLRHSSDHDDYGDLMQIHINANRAAALVSQLLAFSRKQNLRLEVIRFEEVLPDLMHLLSRLVGEKIRLKAEHHGAKVQIRVDRRQLEQVIMNLVVNARDAMPAGGEILVSSSACTLVEPMIRQRATVPAGDYLLVQVIDEGTGIPKDKLSKIFGPFYTTKGAGQGTGLGLSTVYGIVKQSGGYIFAESDAGIGAIFSLYFPVHHPDPTIEALDKFALNADAELESDAPEKAEDNIFREYSEPVEGTGTILLVEDEAPVRNFASRVLEGRGYTVVEADNGDNALKLLEDEQLQVDVFISDVVMPGSNGPTWVRKALAERPDTRVIFVSGYAHDPVTADQCDIPGAVFLPKPFSLEKLADTVAAQFRVRQI